MAGARIANEPIARADGSMENLLGRRAHPLRPDSYRPSGSPMGEDVTRFDNLNVAGRPHRAPALLSPALLARRTAPTHALDRRLPGLTGFDFGSPTTVVDRREANHDWSGSPLIVARKSRRTAR